MCQLCLDAVRRYWPNLPDEDIGTLLLDCTCYPFGSPDDVERQVKEMAEQSGCDLSKAIAIADAETNAK